MQKLKLKMISAAVAMTLLSTLSYGAGLGKLKVSSGLGEPLVAEIELLSVTPEELAGLTAEVASQAAYEAQGIERTSAANSVRVQTGKRADGTAVLRLTSLEQSFWRSQFLLELQTSQTATQAERLSLGSKSGNHFLSTKRTG